MIAIGLVMVVFGWSVIFMWSRTDPVGFMLSNWTALFGAIFWAGVLVTTIGAAKWLWVHV